MNAIKYLGDAWGIYANVDKFREACEENGIRVMLGPDTDVRTNVIHLVLEAEDGASHEFVAPVYEVKHPAWQEALDWVFPAKNYEKVK